MADPQTPKERIQAVIADLEKQPLSRELSLVKTKLEEAVHWLDSHLAKKVKTGA